jgi:hypothetical protein
MMRKIVISFILLFSACSEDLYRDVQGVVKSATPTSLSIPASPTPTITIMGRSATEFQTEFIENTLGSPVANFIIRKVPQKNPVIFELKHPDFDPVISFPYDLKTTTSISLPALAAGTTENIIAQVETLSGQTVTPTTGIILGQLSSEGSSAGGCTPVASVAIKDKETNINVAVVGPFYFDSQGIVVNSSSFSDTQCSYVMANILPGAYILEFFDQNLNKQLEHEVIVLGGNVAFGLDVPQ